MHREREQRAPDQQRLLKLAKKLYLPEGRWYLHDYEAVDLVGTALAAAEGIEADLDWCFEHIARTRRSVLFPEEEPSEEEHGTYETAIVRPGVRHLQATARARPLNAWGCKALWQVAEERSEIPPAAWIDHTLQLEDGEYGLWFRDEKRWADLIFVRRQIEEIREGIVSQSDDTQPERPSKRQDSSVNDAAVEPSVQPTARPGCSVAAVRRWMNQEFPCMDLNRERIYRAAKENGFEGVTYKIVCQWIKERTGGRGRGRPRKMDGK